MNNKPSSKTEAKHTPGPWTYIPRKDAPSEFGVSGPSSVIPGGFRALGTVYGGSRDDEYGANARLIAAAPALLAALKQMVQGIAIESKDPSVIKARIAIAATEAK